MNLSEIRYYFSKDDLFALLKLLVIPVGLVATVFLLWVAVETIDYFKHPTFHQVKQLVETELPAGTDKVRVLVVLDRHKIGHGGYHLIPAKEKSGLQEFESGKLKRNLDRIYYRISAGRDVSNSSWPLGCRGHFSFYFDERGKLIDYEKKQFCDG